MNFDHIVLNVLDMEKMVYFYENVMQLGIEQYEAYTLGKKPFPIVRLSEDNIIDLFPKEMWCDDLNLNSKKRPNMNHFCLCLSKSEWHLLMERLHSHKITIEDGPIQRGGAQGMGMSIYFRDPDNNILEARYYE